MAHYCEHLLFTGTKKRPGDGDVFKAAQSIGGKLNAYTIYDHTKYYLHFPEKHRELAIDILSDMYYCSMFRKKNIDGERRIVNEEYKIRIDDPELYIEDLKYIVGFKGNKYETTTPETMIKSTNNFTRSQLINFYLHFYEPKNCLLVYVGKKNNIKNLITKYFDKRWPYSSLKVSPRFDITDICKNKSMLLKSKPPEWMCKLLKNMNCQHFDLYKITKPVEKTYLCIIFKIDYGSENIECEVFLKKLSMVISGYMGSRLMTSLRIKKGLIYGIDSDLILYPDINEKNPGCFTISTSTSNNNLKDVLKIIINELDDIRRNGLSQKEISNACEYIYGGFKMSLETLDGISDFYGIRKITTGKVLKLKDADSFLKNKKIPNIKKLLKKLINIDATSIMMINNID